MPQASLEIAGKQSEGQVLPKAVQVAHPLELYIPFASANVQTTIRSDSTLPGNLASLSKELLEGLASTRWAGCSEIHMYSHHTNGFEQDDWLNNPNNCCSVYAASVKTRISSVHLQDLELIKDVLESKGYTCELSPAQVDTLGLAVWPYLIASKPVDFDGLEMKSLISEFPQIQNPQLRDLLPRISANQCSDRIKSRLRELEVDLESVTGLQMDGSIQTLSPILKLPDLSPALVGRMSNCFEQILGFDLNPGKQVTGTSCRIIRCNTGNNYDFSALSEPLSRLSEGTGLSITFNQGGIYIKPKTVSEGDLEKLLDKLQNRNV